MNQEHNQEYQNTSPEQGAVHEETDGAQVNSSGEGVMGERESTHPASKSMLIVAVTAVVVVVLALMYIWGTSIALKNKVSTETPPLPPVPTLDEQVETLKKVDTSDEIDAIEADIQNTNLENIDADIEKIEEGIKNPAQ